MMLIARATQVGAVRVSNRAATDAEIRLGAAGVVASFDGPAGAYVHVPFCERICPFCPYDKVRAEADLARRYFTALLREVDRYVSERAAARSGPFTSLYVGGGTPTLYPDRLANVIARVPVSGEVAVEVLPTHATPDRLDRMADMGVTAVSIGAESFHDGVLRRLGRPHDAATSRAAVENALGRFACVDVDLIVDVSWEERGAFPGAFLDDVRTCFTLGVDQVSTYPLMRFGYTPFGTARHDLRREHTVLAGATALARAMGYERRSVWTLNRRGAPTYTSITRPRYLGMGAGSASFAGRDLYVNHFGVATYADAVEHGRPPVARWFHLGRWGGAAYDTFWQAYTGGVDREALERSYGRGVAAAATAGLGTAVLAGLLRRVPHGYRLSSRGFDAYHDLEQLVTYELIEPLWAEMLAERTHLDHPEEWAVPERARRGRAWPLARRLFERPSATAGPRR
jgi:oxygen-independent coproporphyrinogen-3 oxidase